MSSHTEPPALPGVEIERDGEIYLSIPRAAAYVGKSRATLFRYIGEYGWDTYSLPLQGKRAFLRKRDLDSVLSAPAVTRKRPPPREETAEGQKGRQA